MWLARIIVLCAFLVVNGQDESEATKLADEQNNLSENFTQILEHLKNSDIVGCPWIDIDEPLRIRDRYYLLTYNTYFQTRNILVYNVNKLQTLLFNANFGLKKVQAVLSIDTLQARGKSKIYHWPLEHVGEFTLNITGVNITAQANIDVLPNRKLRAKKIVTDIIASNVTLELSKPGPVHSLLNRSEFNQRTIALFEDLKTYILEEVFITIRNQINAKLNALASATQFSTSIPPLDLAIIEVKKRVGEMKREPYQINYDSTVRNFYVNVSSTWISGMTKFQNVGNVTLKLENQIGVMDFLVDTRKLKGTTNWNGPIETGNIKSIDGTATFSAQHNKTRVTQKQPLDNDQPISKEDLHLEIDNVQIRENCNSKDECTMTTPSYLLKTAVVLAIKEPLKEVIQHEINKINVEDVI